MLSKVSAVSTVIKNIIGKVATSGALTGIDSTAKDVLHKVGGLRSDVKNVNDKAATADALTGVDATLG